MSALQPQPVHPLPVLYDLVTSMLVPHIRARAIRAMWPVENLPDRDSPRVFRSDAGKVITTFRDVAKVIFEEQPEDIEPAIERYAMGYLVELVFQRFFAWTVHQSAVSESRRSDTSDFRYRNGAANARAVLALPLLCNLYHDKLRVYIQQGNFAYMAARTSGEQQWIYPHLDHYLDTVYHPWVPLKSIPRSTDRNRPRWLVALEQGITRSKRIIREMWQLLRSGHELWFRSGSDRNLLSVREVVNLFEDRPGNPVSAFVRQAVLGEDLALRGLWSPEGKEPPEPTLPIDQLLKRLVPTDGSAGESPDSAGRTPLNSSDASDRDKPESRDGKHRWNAQLRREREYLFNVAGPKLEERLDQFLSDPTRLFERTETELDYSLYLFGRMDSENETRASRPPYTPRRRVDLTGRDQSQARSKFTEFVRWRTLEESLRLLADRVFLHRRLNDPAVIRPADLSRLRDRGMVVVLVPEIHLNLCVDRQLREPCSSLACAHPTTEKAEHCEKHCQNPRPAGQEPAPATLAREAREKQCRNWIAEAEVAYSCPDDGGRKRSHFWADGLYPFHAIFETLLIGDPRSHTPDDAIMARTLAFLVPPPSEANKPNRPAKAHPAFKEAAEQFRTWVLNNRKEFCRRPLKGLAGREGWIADERLPRGRGQAAWCWLRTTLSELFTDKKDRLQDVTFEELWRAEWPSGGNEDGEDRLSRDFFALASFWSVNVSIFNALGGFGPSESLLNVRLLAPERPDNPAISGRELNDFADFIGTIAEQSHLIANASAEEEDEEEEPNKCPFWTEKEQAWVPDVLRLKLLIRILGTSLVNVERSREWRKMALDEEKDRLRDLTRTLLHGYRKTSINFPFLIEDALEIDDPDDRRLWGRFVRFVVEGHQARLDSVDAGYRQLMEPMNPRGFLQQCHTAVMNRRTEQFVPFLGIVLHGCLLGYLARLIHGGLSVARKNLSSKQLTDIIDDVTNTQLRNCRNMTLQQCIDGFNRLRGKVGHLPGVAVTGVETANRYRLVLPDDEDLAVRLFTCWSLIFAEITSNMLSDGPTDRELVVDFAFRRFPTRVESTWRSVGIPLPSGPGFKLFQQPECQRRPVRMPRPEHEAGGGWGHYGNAHFVEDVMGRLSSGFQHYRLRWIPTEDGRGELATLLQLAEPCVWYRS